MIDFLWNISGFIAAILLLVTVHEGGHFFVARWFKVAIHSFSVGFGPAIWSRVAKDGVVYRLGLIPLGGYVRMYNEDAEAVPEQHLQNAFNRKSVGVRIAVVLAGPMANFILAILLFSLLGVFGVRMLSPVLAQPALESPLAIAGVEEGDLVTAIDQHPVASLTQMRDVLLMASVEENLNLALSVERDGRNLNLRVRIPEGALSGRAPDLLALVGAVPKALEPLAVASLIQAGSAADLAGMQVGDKVIRVDGMVIDRWSTMVGLIADSDGKTLVFEVQRSEGMKTLAVTPMASADGFKIGFVGTIDQQQIDAVYRRVSLSVPEAIVFGFSETWAKTKLTLGMLKKMLIGQASLENISGPITIAQVAGQTAQSGVDYYIGFLALLSISLGVFNLLPIPMLDGGHLLAYAIEILSRRPPSAALSQWAQRVGLTMVLGLTCLALFNDFSRLLG